MKTPPQPIWLALASLLAVPLCIATALVGATLLLIAWPFVPIYVWMTNPNRKQA